MVPSLALAAACALTCAPAGNTCLTPTGLSLGSTPGLLTTPGVDDYYAIVVQPNSEVRVTALFAAAHGDLDLELYERSCGSMVAWSHDAGNDEILEYFDCGGSARELVVRVVVPQGGAVPYDLVVESNPVLDDTFEPNDVCAQPVLAGISTFTTRDLVVTECDPDYYLLRVADQREVRLDLLFDHDESNVDIRLLAPGCGTVLGSSSSTMDSETIVWFNGSGQLMEVVAEVTCSGGRGRAAYGMGACYSLGDQISFPTCVGAINSTGRPSTMCARGSRVAADNFVLFTALDLPSHVFGYFVTSQTTDFVPLAGGGAGTLCLGADEVGRYSYDVLITSSQNAVFYQPDLTRTPAPDSFMPILAGETRYWQFWFRDSDLMGGTTSNFTGAVGVTFL